MWKKDEKKAVNLQENNAVHADFYQFDLQDFVCKIEKLYIKFWKIGKKNLLIQFNKKIGNLETRFRRFYNKNYHDFNKRFFLFFLAQVSGFSFS
jgi:hypothetical protein